MADGGASIWLAYASAGLAAAGTVASTVQQRQNAKAQESQAKREAAMALSVAEQEAADLSERNRRIAASQIASYGANGLLVEGTPASLIADDFARGELDVLRTASGGSNAASSRRFEARQFARNASRTTLAGGLAAAGKGVSGVTAARNSQRARTRAENLD